MTPNEVTLALAAGLALVSYVVGVLFGLYIARTRLHAELLRDSATWTLGDEVEQ